VDRPALDGALPPEMAAKAEDVGVRKAHMPFAPMFLLAVLAGAYIAMGALFTAVATTGSSALPYGVAKVVAGVAFSLGLILVVVAGAELFTGNALLVLAWVSEKVPFRLVARNWAIVYLGNFVGALATVALVFLSDEHMMGHGAVGLNALEIANAKCALTPVVALTRGIYCNALVCLAVWLTYSCRTTGDKILAIIFPITAFIAAGFEHCVANMYIIPMGLLIKGFAQPDFWWVSGSGPDAFPALTWSNFLVANLLPVTIGNIVGGSLFVGAIYWVIYRRDAVRPGKPPTGEPTG
jgi:formate transporter